MLSVPLCGWLLQTSLWLSACGAAAAHSLAMVFVLECVTPEGGGRGGHAASMKG